jgi:hypothetical protein
MVTVPSYLSKADKKASVAICVPVRDYVTAAFSYSLAMLLKKCGETGRKTTLHMVMGSEISSQRQQLALQALQSGCDYVLWIDSDMKFPVDVIETLLGHKKDIVACNYSTRVHPHLPVAFLSDIDMDARLTETTGLSEVYAVGLGCMMVKADVFKNLDLPYFGVNWNKDYTSLEGEDLYFCKKAKSAGYNIYIDNILSQRIAHIGTREYTIKGDCI